MVILILTFLIEYLQNSIMYNIVADARCSKLRIIELKKE